MSLHVQLSPEAQERLKKQRRVSTITSIVISLLVILLIGLILGFILLPSMLKEDVVIVSYAAPSEDNQEIKQKKITKAVQRKPSAPAQSMAKVIAADVAAPMAIPIPDVVVTEPSFEFGDSSDFGEMGWSSGDDSTTGSLFGRQITSGNLGVVLDVSGSAHKHLDKTIAEIDKNFPKAHMVLVVGCGMSDGKGAIGGGGGKVPGKPRVVTYNNIDSEKEYNSLARSAPAQLEDFFRKTGEKRSKELRSYFKNRENLYVLYGGDIHAANFAFEFVLDANVDTIYWFADFADRVAADTIEDLTKKLLQNHVPVIAHNFLGKPVGKLAKEMAEKTGGQTIEIVPGQE